ncbi:carbohydrate ABC transporter permease [Salinibacterium sp. NSLL150]|uniref:carbohydrate ABC transporter permease n=1 Tax=unclassified Salinibacterium TaxID=2632331 RepID=UPI0018CC96F8|nr:MULTISPECIES: carbohydrate ABC transporter permease [unclassified Salinibacterium]MBH0023128.1 carbohydrate ABC transporter permease [Salinibacterium sp. SWN248]MBH0098118.1 carbohydrate ABC transporter permease [Salinibacterium sp. NSLL35]MBH0100873.1 carbohydrate ABC transporter permease [Salinibacterium sp. NSLL150]MBH0103632.1 carbohydrate ABC transporter permease [Salinibacterium sp. NSLL16]MBH0106393.1 carbohydrate ABC transporter permease [Salinibacterium sp. NSLL17]
MSATTTPVKKHNGPRESLFSRAGAMLVMAICTFYFLVPIWWLFVAATKDRADFTTSAPLWFADFNLIENIGNLAAYRDGVFFRWMLNSVLYAGAGAAIATLFATMMGYALAKYSFRGRETLFNVVLGGVLVPATALALPLFLVFSQVGATNTFWSVFLPSIVSPFGVYLARIYATSSVPDELVEAARIDGSGEVRTFFTVATRLMTPAMVTIFLFQFVTIWNNFFLPLIMLRDEKLFPVTLGLYIWNSQVSQIPEIRAYVIIGALLSIIPLIIAFLSLQRFWRSGLGTGAIK